MRKVLFLSILICLLISGPAFGLQFSVDQFNSDITLSNVDTGGWLLGDSDIQAALATPYANPFTIGDGQTIQFEFATLTIDGYGLGAIGSADIAATLAFDTGLNPYIGEGSGEYVTLLFGLIDAGYLIWDTDPGIITLANGDFFEVSFMDIAGINIGCDDTYSIFAQVTGHAAPVPEPGTIVLMGLGLVGLAGMGRKKLFKK